MIIKTIDKLYRGEFKNLNSKFYAYLYPFDSLDLLNGYIETLKSEHPKARHICYAYRCGYEEELFRANDDGEPSGSAGMPILNQLYSYEAKNCIILVVRYFGGNKLGVSGLIEAYKLSAKSALDNAQWVYKEESIKKELDIDLPKYYQLMDVLKANEIDILNTEFGVDSVKLVLEVPISKIEILSPYLDQ